MDPDEVAQNELSYLILPCLQILLFFFHLFALLELNEFGACEQ